MSKRSSTSRRSNKKPKFSVVSETSAPSTASTSSSVHYALHRLQDGRLGQNRRTAVNTSPAQEPEPPPEPDWEDIIDAPVFDGTAPDPPTFEHNLADLQTSQTRKKWRKGKLNWEKLADWLPHRDSFLDELVRLDGPQAVPRPNCHLCGIAEGAVRCRDCWTSALACRDCIIQDHQTLPLHRIEAWTGQFFDKTSLKDLGLRVQLGHAGGHCPTPSEGPKTFTVYDSSGVHQVSVDFCGCPTSTPFPRRVQLLRARWFPTTLDLPRTAFTFDALELFHELTLQGKTTGYDFYNAIVRRTDNSGVTRPPNRVNDFGVVMRLWRHLTMLKRMGRAHDPGGVEATKEGDLAVECPACPQPDRNLPEGWKEAPAGVRWLYTLFLAIDANFRQKLKDRQINDIELAPGWAYYVEERRYQEWLSSCVDETETSTCESQHDAIVQANTRNAKGQLASGVGAVVCARHGLIRRNGAGDLQKGEKYANMDYLVFSTLVSIILLALVLSYDISCQWSRNFFKRLRRFPEHMQMDTDNVDIEFVVPKWHLNAHGLLCQSKFSLNYLVGAARTCTEIVETSWSHTNIIATSTREMGPGARHETLNDHWGSWNWQKVIGFGSYLQKHYIEAVRNASKHRILFSKFSATFSDEVVGEWQKMVDEWNEDRSKPNPYQEPPAGMTLHDVRLELQREEAADAARGNISAHEISISSFLDSGLDLEDQQHVLQQSIKEINGPMTSKEKADIQRKRNALFRRIRTWRDVQAVYMPCVQAQLLAPSEGLRNDSVAVDDDDDDSDNADDYDSQDNNTANSETIQLWLPSAIPHHLQSTLPSNIFAQEKRLRLAQAEDALAEVRRHRRVLTGLHEYRRRNIMEVGQKANTRQRALFTRFNQKTARAVARYRCSRQALLVLDPQGSWADHLLPLLDGDVRGPSKEDDGVSEGRREQSWIWLVIRGGSEDNYELDDTMRLEWAKSKARADRWAEEVILLEEEMRRVLKFFEWQAKWWRDRRSLRSDAAREVREGLASYAEKQAVMRERLAVSFAHRWLPVLKHNGRSPEWEHKYKNLRSHNASVVGQMSASDPTTAPLPSSGGNADNDVNEEDEELDEDGTGANLSDMDVDEDVDEDMYNLDD